MNYVCISNSSYTDFSNCIQKSKFPFLASVYSKEPGYLLVNSSNFLDYKVPLDFYSFSPYGLGSGVKISYSNSQCIISIRSPELPYKKSHFNIFVETGRKYLSLYISYAIKKSHNSNIFITNILQNNVFGKSQLKLNSIAKYALVETNEFFQKFSVAQFFNFFFSSYFAQRLIRKNKKLIQWPFFFVIESMLERFWSTRKTKEAEGAFISTVDSVEPAACHLHISRWGEISRKLIKKLKFRIDKFRFLLRYCKYSLAIGQRKHFRKKNIKRFRYQFGDWIPGSALTGYNQKIRRSWLLEKFRISEEKIALKQNYVYARLLYRRMFGIRSHIFDLKIQIEKTTDFFKNYLKQLFYFAEILPSTSKFYKKILQFSKYFTYCVRFIQSNYMKYKKKSKFNINQNIKFRFFEAVSRTTSVLFKIFLGNYLGHRVSDLRLALVNVNVRYILLKLRKTSFVFFNLANSMIKYSSYIVQILPELLFNCRAKFLNSKVLFKSKFPFLYLIGFASIIQNNNNPIIRTDPFINLKRRTGFYSNIKVREETYSPSYNFRSYGAFSNKSVEFLPKIYYSDTATYIYNFKIINMPQLDTLIFFNQFFWFFLSFFFIYYFFSYLIIPKINFYYFVRYNIKQSLDNLEQKFDIEKSTKYFIDQVIFELSIPYNIIFSKFCISVSDVLEKPFNYSGLFPIGLVNVNVLALYMKSKRSS